MTFQIGQRVRCVTREYSDRPELVQEGEEFTVLDIRLTDNMIWLVEKGHGHGYYHQSHFVDASTVRVGSTVTCTDSRGSISLRHGFQYAVGGIRDGKYLINGSWVRASRFGRRAVHRVRVEPYQQMPYYGCCGAGLIYFSNDMVAEDRVVETIKRLTLPGYLCVLNSSQNKKGGPILERNGFKFVGKTASRTSRDTPLYHYLFTKIEATLPPERVTEAPRVF